MVCNAGRTKHKPALDFTTEEIEQLWNVNVRILWFFFCLALRALSMLKGYTAL